MSNENENLTNENENATIITDDNEQAAGQTPEDTANVNRYERIIESQNKTIDSLISQVESLNAQIAKVIRQTPVAVDPSVNAAADNAPAKAIPEDYVYLKDLGKEIGKR